MITFLASVALLIVGYLVYGKLVEKVFGIQPERPTPAYAMRDDVDYVPLDTPRAALIQLLNIAGLGPVFGPILGALWGPAAFIWIVLGSIFAGAVHDYLCGMMSVRHGGANMPALVGTYLGKGMRAFVNVFTVVLLILVGAVFVTGPADLLATLTPAWMDRRFWVTVIIVYYILATLLPVDKIIGRVYPFFGALLLIMALGVGAGLLLGDKPIPELTLANLHPDGLPIWPLMFVTIACGAISGFHATQSPIVARVVQNERNGRFVFYGMMIGEALIALVWAAAGMTLFDGPAGLKEALAQYGGPAGVVRQIAILTMGSVGSVLAILGVVVLPITSGDTAFRGARLVLAEMLNMPQKEIAKRLLIAVPLFVVGFGLTMTDFDFLWRYFAWANQTTAMIMLWAAAAYLLAQGKNHLIASVPAAFMTAVSFTYILQAPEGFRLPTTISYPAGLAITAAVVALFASRVKGRHGLTPAPGTMDS
ncbi:MAG: carbon starvation protein A [Firmicutes bacterium]|nr:carbon starvation protein A [Bacillota bacterium]